MSNNVPEGGPRVLVPPSGVEERAGGLAGRVLIERLRASIRALEQVPVSLSIPPAQGAASSPSACSLTPTPLASTPLPAPFDVLHQGGLHEIKPHAYRDTPAGLGFALSVIAGLGRQEPNTQGSDLVLWCMTGSQAREWGRPYGPGLIKAGFDPARFLIVETRSAKEAAWALEEGLKSGALTACLAQGEVKTPLIARRLGLAARAAGIPCFLLTPHGAPSIPGVLSRWRIATEASAHIPFDIDAPVDMGVSPEIGVTPSAARPGTACWRLSLEQCRSHMAGQQTSPQVAQSAVRQQTSPQVAQSAIGQQTSPQVAQSAIGQQTSPQVAQSAVAQEKEPGGQITNPTRFHVEAPHGRGSTKESGAPDGLRVVPTSSNRADETGAITREPYTATG